MYQAAWVFLLFCFVLMLLICLLNFLPCFVGDPGAVEKQLEPTIAVPRGGAREGISCQRLAYLVV